MKHIVPILVVLLFATSAEAQTQRVLDSLDRILSRKIPDTLRINTLIDYAQILSIPKDLNLWIYEARSHFWGNKFTIQALELSRKIYYNYGEAKSLLLLENYASPLENKKQWSDTLDVALNIATHINNEELISRIMIRKSQKAIKNRDSISALQYLKVGQNVARKNYGKLLWFEERMTQVLFNQYFSRDETKIMSILDTLYDYSLQHPIEVFPSKIIGLNLAQIAGKASGQNKELSQKILQRFQRILAQSEKEKNIYLQAQLNEIIGYYYYNILWNDSTDDEKKFIQYYDHAKELYNSMGSHFDAINSIDIIVSQSFKGLSKEKKINYMMEQLQLSEKIRDIERQFSICTYLARLYQSSNLMAKSAQFYEKAKNTCDQLDYIGSQKSSILMSLGDIYQNVGQFEKAIQYYNESLDIIKNNDYDLGPNTIRFTDSKAQIYKSFGDLFLYSNQPDSALMYYKTRWIVDKKAKTPPCNADIDISIAFSKLGKPDSSEIYLRAAQTDYNDIQPEWAKKVISRSFSRDYTIALSNMFFAKKNYDSSIFYGEKSYADLKPYYGKSLLSTTDILWQSYKAQGNYIKALEYFEKYRSIQDSLSSNELTQQLSLAQTNSELERKINEIELLKRDGKLREAHLKEQELLAAQIKLENVARLSENRALLNSNLLNEETIKRQNQEQKTLEALAAKQSQENKLLAQEKEIQSAEVKQQRIMSLATAFGLCIMGILAFVLFRSNRQKNRQNLIIEAERKKSEELLLNVLPASIAERLKAGERNIADHYKCISILFADIVGFTSLSTRYEPRTMVSMLNNLYTRFDRLTELHGVERIKTIGDAYMVVSGAPESCDNHAERIVQFALDMQKELKSFSNEINEKIELRIGISCGEAVGAVVGEKKFAYDLWSDAVNTASRMESHGESGKIHVSRELMDELILMDGELPTCKFTDRGEIDIKGKGIMRTYFLEHNLN